MQGDSKARPWGARLALAPQHELLPPSLMAQLERGRWHWDTAFPCHCSQSWHGRALAQLGVWQEELGAGSASRWEDAGRCCSVNVREESVSTQRPSEGEPDEK